MVATSWPTDKWPPGVAKDIDPAEYEKPLFAVLDESARDYPNNTYTIFNGAVKTFAQVKDTADRVADFLVSAGIKKGDRVAIFLPNLPHYPEIFFGILKTGAICVTCNPLYTATELSYQLLDSGARIVFCMDHSKYYHTATEAIKNTRIETVIYCNVKSYLPRIKGLLGSLLGKIPKAESHDPSHYSFDNIVASARPRPPQVSIDPSRDPALIIYTGGTTGQPKGAVLSHTNFTYDIKAVEEWARLTHEPGKESERLRTGGFHTYIGVLPWYHVFGLTVCMLLACNDGSRLLCIPDPRAGKPPFTEVLEAVQKYGATLMPAVPTIFVAFTNHSKLDKYDLTSIMGCFSGGAPLPPEVCRQFEAKTGAIIYEGYGLSETAPVVSCNPTSRETRKLGTIGFPMPGTDIKVVDLETGQKELPGGEDGEIAVSGPQVMKGYWNRPEENQAVFRQLDDRRYFLTGDIGHIDEEGYITITDRKKDMILVGGFNVYPRDVEDILYQHPKIQLVAVVGVPNAKSGEAVKAYIQLKPEEHAEDEEIRQFCKENMAPYKRPKYIEFRDNIPISSVGKVLRRILRDEELNKKAE